MNSFLANTALNNARVIRDDELPELEELGGKTYGHLKVISEAVDAVVDRAIEEGKIVGSVIHAAVSGRAIYRRAAGYSDREARRPMVIDQIFRLASMTKAVVSATALALIEQGYLRLEDPVVRWLPRFRPKLPSGREPIITVRHLITHTSGLTYGFLENEAGEYHRLGVSDGLDESGLTLSENVERIGSATLLYEPGTSWSYSVATDVLGAVIERVTGKTLADAVEQIITVPLGMKDTAFVLENSARLATPYADGTYSPVRMTDSFSLPFAGSAISYAPSRTFNSGAFASGGTGLVGTAADYIRFLEAIRTGKGVLGPRASLAFTTNAVGALPVPAAGDGYGWGLGVAVLEDPEAARSPANKGAWSWSGVYGTSFWVDPKAGLSVVALTNTAITGMSGEFPNALRDSIYSALRAGH